MATRWSRPQATWRLLAAADAAMTVATLAREEGLRRVALSEHPLLERLGVGRALVEAGITVLPPPPTIQEIQTVLAGADAGVTMAAYAVAETGTLVERPSPGQPHALSLLPPVHIAIVRDEDVLPTLDDLFARLAAEEPQTVLLISGPSGTADIGLQHVVGVHGPRRVHLLVVEGGGGS